MRGCGRHGRDCNDVVADICQASWVCRRKQTVILNIFVNRLSFSKPGVKLKQAL